MAFFCIHCGFGGYYDGLEGLQKEENSLSGIQ